MTHAMEGGIYVTRCAIGFTLTRNRDVDCLWKLVHEKYV